MLFIYIDFVTLNLNVESIFLFLTAISLLNFCVFARLIESELSLCVHLLWYCF